MNGLISIEPVTGLQRIGDQHADLAAIGIGRSSSMPSTTIYWARIRLVDSDFQPSIFSKPKPAGRLGPALRKNQGRTLVSMMSLPA